MRNEEPEDDEEGETRPHEPTRRVSVSSNNQKSAFKPFISITSRLSNDIASPPEAHQNSQPQIRSRIMEGEQKPLTLHTSPYRTGLATLPHFNCNNRFLFSTPRSSAIDFFQLPNNVASHNFVNTAASTFR